VPVVIEVLPVACSPINKLEPSVNRAAPFHILVAHCLRLGLLGSLLVVGWSEMPVASRRLEDQRGKTVPNSGLELSRTLFPDQCSKRAHNIKALVLRQHWLLIVAQRGRG
jgi:hypothetical protein